MENNLKIGDKIVTSIHKSGMYEEELEVVSIEQYDENIDSYYFTAVDESYRGYEIPYEYYGSAPYAIVLEPTIIKANPIKPSDKVRVLSDQYENLQQPLYNVMETEEQGVVVIDDNNEKASLSYNSVEKLEDSYNTFLDMATALSTQFVEFKKKLDSHENVFRSLGNSINKERNLH